MKSNFNYSTQTITILDASNHCEEVKGLRNIDSVRSQLTSDFKVIYPRFLTRGRPILMEVYNTEVRLAIGGTPIQNKDLEILINHLLGEQKVTNEVRLIKKTSKSASASISSPVIEESDNFYVTQIKAYPKSDYELREMKIKEVGYKTADSGYYVVYASSQIAYYTDRKHLGKALRVLKEILDECNLQISQKLIDEKKKSRAKF